MTTNSITNLEETTFTVGDRLRHSAGWTGVLVEIDDSPYRTAAMLKVLPDNPADLPARDYYALNAASAAQSGKTHFCRPLDHGYSMGNFTVVESPASDLPRIKLTKEWGFGGQTV